MTNSVKIISPESFIEEKKYTFDLIFEFFGLKFDIEFKATDEYEILLPNGKSIIFKDTFFASLKDYNTYLNADFIPKETKTLSNSYAEKLTVIYGDDSFTENENGAILGLDIIASIFFMISRWEEVAVKERDDHGRFPGHLSLAVKNEFIKRPIVDEYIQLLKLMIRKLDPGVVIKEHSPEVAITSDIDSFAKFNSGKTLKMFAGHLLKRFSPGMFFTDLFQLIGKSLLGKKEDRKSVV